MITVRFLSERVWLFVSGLQTSLQLGSKLLTGFGVMSDDVSFLSKVFRDSMEIQAQEEITASETNAGLKPMQMKASDINVVSAATQKQVQLMKPMQMKASDSNSDSAAEILQETAGLSQPPEIDDSSVNIDNGFVGKADKAQD